MKFVLGLSKAIPHSKYIFMNSCVRSIEGRQNFGVQTLSCFKPNVLRHFANAILSDIDASLANSSSPHIGIIFMNHLVIFDSFGDLGVFPRISSANITGKTSIQVVWGETATLRQIAERSNLYPAAEHARSRFELPMNTDLTVLNRRPSMVAFSSTIQRPDYILCVPFFIRQWCNNWVRL